MEINRNNYEAYFLDYLEGNLDKNIVDDFIEFLQQNPDLKEELSVTETISVVPENISFNKKNSLYKEKLDSEKEFDRAAIAALEGDISATDKNEFENYLARHPDKERDVLLFGKTKLRPDEKIVFKNKKKLYRRPTAKIVFLWTSRIAAVLILAFALFALFNNKTNRVAPVNKIAEVEKSMVKKTNPGLIKKPVVSKKAETKIKAKAKAKVKENKKETPKPKNKTAVPIHKTKKANKTKEEEQSQKMVTIKRTPIEIPPKINPIIASVSKKQLPVKMGVMHITIPDDTGLYNDEFLLADKIKEKTGLDKFELNKITKAGLNLVETISKNKFQYETNEEGKVTKYNYKSRLLAFSIPSKNSSPK
jgi:hypothetical protein